MLNAALLMTQKQTFKENFSVFSWMITKQTLGTLCHSDRTVYETTEFFFNGQDFSV